MAIMKMVKSLSAMSMPVFVLITHLPTVTITRPTLSFRSSSDIARE